MKLLVTGGAGFIGSEFVRKAVEKNYNVVVVDCLTYAGDLKRLDAIRDDIKFYNCSIEDKSALMQIFQDENPESVVHFAAETHVDRSILDASPFMTTNVIGTNNLLEMAKKFNIEKFINIATDEVYGELGADGQFFEDTPLMPNSPYSVSKTSADMLGRAYFRTYNLPVVTLRPSNNYGHWQYPEKLVPVVILKAIRDEKIPVYGAGLNVREWLFVSDCADAILIALEKAKAGSVYNIGSNNEKQNIEVVKSILKLLDKDENLIEFVKDRLGHDFRYSVNIDKIKNELGWTPKVNFEEGIKSTVQWYLDNNYWVESKLDYLRQYWAIAYK